jgi:ABC-type oligopeptide transport system substrate-binding subunit
MRSLRNWLRGIAMVAACVTAALLAACGSPSEKPVADTPSPGSTTTPAAPSSSTSSAPSSSASPATTSITPKMPTATVSTSPASPG